MSLRSIAATAAAVCFTGALIYPALADDQPAPPAHPTWNDPIFGGIMFSGNAEVGSTFNVDGPKNNTNFGQGFNDSANSFRMNQAILNVEADLDPKNAGFQYGFKFTGLYGTNARYTHFFNEFDRATNSPYQFDILELDALFHVPLPAPTGGIDMHVGQYPTPLGYEVMDASLNPFYSHSYIFTYGLPFKHTGILATAHLNDTLDLWLGWDTGVNDSLGSKGVNNASLGKGIVGFGLNGLMGGNLTILSLAHIGAENPTGSTVNGVAFNVNAKSREYWDTVITYKINDAWTSVTELNMIHDDAYRVTGKGAATYLLWKLNDQWSFGGRAEAFGDQAKNGFTGFVCAPQSSEDLIDAQRGIPFSNAGTKNPVGNQLYCGQGSTAGTVATTPYNLTYGELTIGASYTPPVTLPGTLGLVIRPEARLDTIVGGGKQKPFDVGSTGAGTKTSQYTFAVDAILSF